MMFQCFTSGEHLIYPNCWVVHRQVIHSGSETCGFNAQPVIVASILYRVRYNWTEIDVKAVAILWDIFHIKPNSYFRPTDEQIRGANTVALMAPTGSSYCNFLLLLFCFLLLLCTYTCIAPADLWSRCRNLQPWPSPSSMYLGQDLNCTRGIYPLHYLLCLFTTPTTEQHFISPFYHRFNPLRHMQSSAGFNKNEPVSFCRGHAVKHLRIGLV